MVALRNYGGASQTRLGLRLLLLTGVRTGELRLATPDQFDLEKRLWVIPAEVVKQLQLAMRKPGKQIQNVPPYIVPLSVQALEIVRHLLDQVVPAQRYLFAHRSDLSKRISEKHAERRVTPDGVRRSTHGSWDEGDDLDGAERDRLPEGVGGCSAFSC